MRKLLSVITSLALLFPLINLVGVTPTYALDDCRIRFLDKNNSDKDVTTFYPDTAFKVLIWNIPTSDQGTYFSVVGKDANSGIFAPFQPIRHAGQDGMDNGTLILIFPNGSGGGYINDNVDGVTTTGLTPGTYTVTAYQLTNGTQISSAQPCGSQQFSVQDYSPQSCSVNCARGFCGTSVTQNRCDQGYSPKVTSGQCSCVANGSSATNGNNGANANIAKCIDTDLGCIPTDPRGLANAILNIILGLAGGIATILIIIGGFKVASSQGNVEDLEDGRDMITKAITGLVFILLASVILSIIGLDILGLNFAFGPTGIFPIVR